MSWNTISARRTSGRLRHPLREDVSWNVSGGESTRNLHVILFVRMWVEISLKKRTVSDIVILFVRMWVEMLQYQQCNDQVQSSSSWGCELKCQWAILQIIEPWSSSSWGCELKYRLLCILIEHDSHPLREDVSWNELKKYNALQIAGHPLREDVSWNKRGIRQTRTGVRHPLREDVSWNAILEI